MQVEKHVISMIFMDLELEVIPTGTGGGVPRNGGGAQAAGKALLSKLVHIDTDISEETMT